MRESDRAHEPDFYDAQEEIAFLRGELATALTLLRGIPDAWKTPHDWAVFIGRCRAFCDKRAGRVAE